MANIRNNCTFCILFFSYWHSTLCFLLPVNAVQTPSSSPPPSPKGNGVVWGNPYKGIGGRQKISYSPWNPESGHCAVPKYHVQLSFFCFK